MTNLYWIAFEGQQEGFFVEAPSFAAAISFGRQHLEQVDGLSHDKDEPTTVDTVYMGPVVRAEDFVGGH